MSKPNDITTKDALTHIREHPSMYFRSGKFSAAAIISWIAEEAILRRAQEIAIKRDGDWYLVYADIDWLANLEHDPFNAIVPYTGGGPNSMLGEVPPTAFAADVFTVASGELRKIKGESPLPNYDQLEAAGRVVGFRSLI